MRRIKMWLRSFNVNRYRRNIVIYILLFLFLLFSFKLYSLIPTRPSKSQSGDPEIRNVLLWNKPADMTDNLSFNHCEFSNCKLSIKREDFNMSGTVLFWPTTDQLPEKKVGQVWVYINLEPPPMTDFSFSKWRRKFNWTMTYRRDSDIYFSLYGHFEPRTMRNKTDIQTKIKEILRYKTKEAAWFVSHCKTSSKREEYIVHMNQSLNIDVYGGCGKLKCSRKDEEHCRKILKRQYSFYLAFENSICRDYLTEKSIKNMFEVVIPVLRGVDNPWIFLPPNSYIDTNTFTSPGELANYLKRLIKNKHLQEKFYKWRQDYIASWKTFPSKYICDICKRLNHRAKYTGVYEDVEKWWNDNTNVPICNIYPRDIIG